MIIRGTVLKARTHSIGTTAILLESEDGYVNILSLDSTIIRNGDKIIAKGKFRTRGELPEFCAKTVVKM